MQTENTNTPRSQVNEMGGTEEELNFGNLPQNSESADMLHALVIHLLSAMITVCLM